MGEGLLYDTAIDLKCDKVGVEPCNHEQWKAVIFLMTESI
jgi:hypothetical protein